MLSRTASSPMRSAASTRVIASLWMRGKGVGRRAQSRKACSPLSLSVYINVQTSDEDDRRLGEAYRDNLTHLAEVKASYDPDNLFRVNRNIAPAGSVGIGAD
jgi:hypothetical protein